ncbi:unnamed protein product [Ranitomeya imitator]|uniref:Arf-GAP with coiled-coil, ANK repeat and PH domain-containing protein n=1 Tax=Ranitomeya imitator TaxID=111125 RepID=A0ABN9MR61_9NEOB|nr:unnamed protein product [Ranitomeya imitator]
MSAPQETSDAQGECTPPPPEWAVAMSQSVSDLTKVSQSLVQVLERLPQLSAATSAPNISHGDSHAPDTDPQRDKLASCSRKRTRSGSSSSSPGPSAAPKLLSSSQFPSSEEDLGSDIDSQSGSDSDSDQTSSMQAIVDSLISAISQTLKLKQDEAPSQDPSISFKRVKHPSLSFPNHEEFESTLSKHWEHPEKRFSGRKHLDVLYPFSADLLSSRPVRIQSDNTTAVAYSNHQGGTRSSQMMAETAKILSSSSIHPRISVSPNEGSKKEILRQEKEAYIKAKYVEKKFVDNSVESKLMARKKMLSRKSSDNRLSSSDKSLGVEELSRAASRASVKSNDSGIQFSADGSRELLSSAGSSNSLYDADSASFSHIPEMEKKHEKRDSAVFPDTPSTKEIPGLQLYRAAFQQNLPAMSEALAHGAEVNWVNKKESNSTPLIKAVHGGSLVTCEFLLQNGANVNHRDVKGRGPLHHATVLGHTGQVCLFLKRGANQHATDEDGKDPLSIAVEAANADIVTLLRLARMNEEMRESEGLYGQPGQYSTNSHTEMQYRKCMQEFISLQLGHPESLGRKMNSNSSD